MTILQLRYVVALDTHRHFGRAARHCHVTQPTLSMQIRKLEQQLGVDLFDRNRQPVEPTDIGRQVIAQARVVLREAERLGALVQEVEGEIAGELRVGVIPTLAPYLLPRFLSDLVRRHPRLALRVEELQTEQILERLRRDDLDAALLATSSGIAGLVERPLFEEPFVAYIGEGHRLSDRTRLAPEDLRLDDLWLLNQGHCFRDQVLHLCGDAERAGDPGGLRFESGNLETLKRLVERSGGMTLLPELAVVDFDEAERRRLRPFAAPPPARLVRLVAAGAYLKRRLVDAFAEATLHSVPRRMRLHASARAAT